MKNVRLRSMGLDTDHPAGCIRRDRKSMPCFVLIEMLTPGMASTSEGVKRLEANDCILYLPGTTRVLEGPDERSGFRNNWVFFEAEDMEDTLTRCGVKPGCVYHPEAVNRVTDCFMMLFAEYIRPNHGEDEMAELLLRQLLLYMVRGSRMEGREQAAVSRYSETLARLRFDIYRQAERDWNVEEIARELGMSAAWLNVLYRERYGLSPKQDILHARIERAYQLLTYTDSPLRVVAQQCGFQNEYYFSRAFHRQTGLAPGEYRRSHRE